MNDFDPSIRNQALWATDSRKVADGKSADVYLERIGKVPAPDLSDVEAVQWGKRLESTIADAVSDRLGVELRHITDSLTHQQHPWMRSHFDYVRSSTNELIEIKNYGQHQRKHYGDDGSQHIKPADKAQLIHECAVYGTTRATLAVLFGGQELVLFPMEFSPDEIDAWIAQLAKLWDNIKTQTPPDTLTVEAAKMLYPLSIGLGVPANQAAEQAASQLKAVKTEIKRLEEMEANLQGALQGYMKEGDTLVAPDGAILATWKSAKASMRFSTDLFKASMPDVYDRFVVEQPGSRRFLVK